MPETLFRLLQAHLMLEKTLHIKLRSGSQVMQNGELVVVGISF